jgi:histidinol-phosphate aminotransferase
VPCPEQGNGVCMRSARRDFLRTLGASATVTIAAGNVCDGWIRRESARSSTAISGFDRTIRLDRNEDAYGASPATVAAMREALAGCHRYPEAEQEALRVKLAIRHRVAPEQVILDCGSREILRSATAAFLRGRKRLVRAVPTFPETALCAQRAGAEVVDILLRHDFSHDLGRMLAQCTRATGLVYICNPNNPTATLTPRQDIEAFLTALPPTIHVVIDEAYHHYVEKSSDYFSFIDRPVNDPRVIVTRSFSKIYGLAGLRIGYAVADPATARLLDKSRLAPSVNIVAAKAAATALDEGDHLRAKMRRNADDRQQFFNQANARMLRLVDSRTNFVLLNTGRPAAEVVNHFSRHHVLLAGPFPRLETYVRVSLGLQAEMQEFWRVWDMMPPTHKMTM